MRLKRLVVATIVALFLLPAVSASALSTNRIEAVSFSNATTGYLVGGYSPTTGFLSVTTDGGMTWSTSNVPGEWFKSVAAGPTGALAFPEFKRYSYGTEGASGSWTKRGDIAGAGPRIADLAVLSGGRVAAVGENYGAANTGNPALIVSSNDNGTTWTGPRYEGPEYPPAPGSEDDWIPTRAGLTAIDTAGDGMVAFAVGNEYNALAFPAMKRWLIYKTEDGGTNWVLQTAPPTTGATINSVAMANANVAYAAGGNRVLLKTVNGGTTWSKIDFLRKDTFTSFNANDIAAVDAQTIVAVGDFGIIYKSTDGGATVANITYTRLPGNPDLRDVEILDANTWIAVGDDRAIFRTTNAGASWGAATPPATPDPVVAPVGGPTTLSSSVSAAVIAYNGSATITGVLTVPSGAPVANQKLEIWSRSYVSGSKWKKSTALRTTDINGSVSWTAKPKVRTYYQIRYPGAGGYSASTATVRLISPKVSLTAPRNGSAVKRGRVYTWYGYLKPKHTTGSSVARLQFQRKVGGVYKPYKTLTAKGYYTSSSTTRYSLRTSLPTKGMWRVRAYHKDAGHQLTYSGWLYKNVK